MNFNRRRADPVAPEKPHFFKVILTDTITEGKLGIPKVFARKYGSMLPNQVTLKVLPDSVWTIELTRSDGVIWLQNGWKQFLDYYSIVLGHFLVFRYEKNSHFSVAIFDPTATEIDYPYALIHEDEEAETEESEDSVSVETSDNIVQSSKRRQKSQLSNPWPQKMVRTNSTTKVDRRRKSQDDKGGLEASTILRRLQSKILRMELLTSDEKAACLEMASGFVSDYPRFKVTMQPSFVRGRGVLNIPADFARQYMNKKTESVILLDSDQRRWNVSYYGGSSFPAHPTARFQHGWLKFACNYNLEVGDVCVFELIRRNETSFRVTTFKFREYGKLLLSPGGYRSKSNLNQLVHQETTGQQRVQGRTLGPRELADKFTSADIIRRDCTVREFSPIKFSFVSDQTAPWTFTEKLTKQSAEKDWILVHLQFGEKSWLMKFRSYPEHKQGRFGSGWLVFARENSLEIDDVCIFEVINKDDAIVKVSIFKKIG